MAVVVVVVIVFFVGGGGAIGVIYLNDLPVTSGGTYSVTIGEGGEGLGR